MAAVGDESDLSAEKEHQILTEFPPQEREELDKEMFLQALRGFACLWDTSEPIYKNRTTKLNAWICLAQMFNQDVPYLQKVFKNLKDSLKKCLDRRRALSKSGAAATTLPKCKHFEAMRFLHEKTTNLDTHSNVELEVQAMCNNSFDLTSPLHTQDSIKSPSSCSSISDDAKCAKRKRVADKEENDPFLHQVKVMDERMLDCLGKFKHRDDSHEKDEAELFCNSLIPVLRDMDKRKLRLAKLKIQQLLYDLEYADN